LDAGNPGASYLWSPGGETTPVITANASGTYTVTVTNACGSSTGSAVVTIITTSAIGSVTPSGPTTFCQGGSVVLTATTGTAYLWSTGETTQAISVNQTGNYSVTITTAQGCQILSPVTGVNVLPGLPTPVITSSGSGNICNGQSITLTSSSATGNTWNPNGLQSQSVIVSNPGSYTVTVSNGQCSATSTPFVVTLNFPPSAVITAIGNTTFCKGDSVLLQAPAAASYTWFKVGLNGNPDINIGSNSSVVVNQSGDYYVVVTGANGCTRASFPPTNVVAQDTVVRPTFTVDGVLSPCNSGSFITLTAASAANYQWSQGETTQSIRVIGPGNYYLTVTNSFGCSKNSDTLVVNLTPSPTITLNLTSPVFNPGGHNVSLPGASDGQIDLTVSGGLAPFQFTWTKDGAGFIGSSEDLIGLKAGVYSVLVTDAGGCTAEASITLTEPKEFKLSNGFSPNNDGKNDQFIIGSIELYPDNDITIYNRWGNVVYSKTGYANDWEGLSNSGETLADGTYFVVVNVRSNGASQQLKGYVDLRR
jgi:gliding motility-associated-like protein